MWKLAAGLYIDPLSRLSWLVSEFTVVCSSPQWSLTLDLSTPYSYCELSTTSNTKIQRSDQRSMRLALDATTSLVIEAGVPTSIEQNSTTLHVFGLDAHDQLYWQEIPDLVDDRSVESTNASTVQYCGAWNSTRVYPAGSLITTSLGSYVSRHPHSNREPNVYSRHWAVNTQLPLAQWRQEWSSTRSYASNQMIEWKTSLYRASSTTPTIGLPPDAEHSTWTIVADAQHWKGAYSDYTVYKRRMVVESQARLYQCLYPTSTSPCANSRHWRQIAELRLDELEGLLLRARSHHSPWSRLITYQSGDLATADSIVYIALRQTNTKPREGSRDWFKLLDRSTMTTPPDWTLYILLGVTALLMIVYVARRT